MKLNQLQSCKARFKLQVGSQGVRTRPGRRQRRQAGRLALKVLVNLILQADFKDQAAGNAVPGSPGPGRPSPRTLSTSHDEGKLKLVKPLHEPADVEGRPGQMTLLANRCHHNSDRLLMSPVHGNLAASSFPFLHASLNRTADLSLLQSEKRLKLLDGRSIAGRFWKHLQLEWKCCWSP